MENKIELKKAIYASLIVVTIFVILFVILLKCEYNEYKRNFNNANALILEKVTEKYPSVTKEELIYIINNKHSEEIDSTSNNSNTSNNNSSSNYSKDINITKSSKLLEEYGIDINKESVLLENEIVSKKFIVINIIAVIILSVVIVIIFLIYNSKKNNKLAEITKYIEEINRKNYKLNIEDNTEDELSILKNEVYKISVNLKEQAENLKKEKISLKDSLSNISHQLKTPLTSIIIMLDNILDNPEMDNEIKLDFLKDIKRETINISFLVQALLKLSKLDSNTINFISSSVKIKYIIDESIKNVSAISDLKNVEIVVIGNLEENIVCDAKWQTEAISNVLKNAVEYSKEKGIVKIEYEKNKVYSEIRIIDSGKGINDEDLKHIFERFYKGKNSYKESVGIGLALAKSIVEQNGGKIYVNSTLGKGTMFTIRYFDC